MRNSVDPVTQLEKELEKENKNEASNVKKSVSLLQGFEKDSKKAEKVRDIQTEGVERRVVSHTPIHFHRVCTRRRATRSRWTRHFVKPRSS